MSSNPLLRVSEEAKEKVRETLNLDDAGIKQAIAGIKAWLYLQPHLPDEEDDERIERWLIRCKNSVEKAKEKLDLYFSLRSFYPEIMCGCDARQRWFEETSRYGYAFAMPDLTPDLDRVVLLGYFPKKLGEEYNMLNGLKMMIMASEIRMTEDYCLKDLYVIDMKTVTMDHMKNFTIPIVKKAETCFLRGYNARLRALHIINVNAFTEVVVAIIKSVLKSKLVSRVHVYGNDLTEFHKQVPPSILPKELGGECGTIEEHWDRWKAKFRERSEWFNEREKMKSDETRRTSKSNFISDSFGTEGSFRKLCID